MTSTQNGAQAGTAFGRYTLICPIGRGGMAEVWKAKIHGPQNFQRLVVVKRILPHLTSDPTFVRMFTDEAVVSARLNHPNIVQVFEFAEVAGEHYLAMEFVHGVNVGEIMKRIPAGQVPVGMAAYVVREVCLALAYAHGLHDDDGRDLAVIHRDVSPSNIMIGYDGSVKLVDFGVAKVLSHSDEMTRTGALKGKVGYMSPEAIEGELELDGRTDLFSAGVLLHELLTGRRLFKGHDDLRTIALVRACRVESPSFYRTEVPPEVDAIVGRALARDREARFATAMDLADALSQIVHDTGWDAAQTAAYLKQHGIQPGSEPELKAVTPPAAPAQAAPETLLVTVVERRGRSGPNATPTPSPPLAAAGSSSGGMSWALAGALGALGMTIAVAGGWRIWSRTPGSNDAQSVGLGTRVATTVPATVPAPGPAPERISHRDLAALVAGAQGPKQAVTAPSIQPVADRHPVADRTGNARVATSTVAGIARAEKAKRRRKGPRRAPRPATEATPRIDLKRGDVVPNF